jgi:hypothetical protein
MLDRDPRRDARAERRARELLEAAAGAEVAAMYEELGFVGIEPTAAKAGTGGAAEEPAYGYLVYPHRPIVSYDAESGELLSEYCVRFSDRSDAAVGERLPDADDVLAKWLALRNDEAHILGIANLDLPGRQLDPGMVRRDLAALRKWRLIRDAGVGA